MSALVGRRVSMPMRIGLVLWMLAVASTPSVAQELSMNAGTLAHEFDRLTNTGRVLYVAAHPDDENTRLLAYLVNGRHVTAAYLAMTRGGGGQNLIGPEQAELLDVIRTEELLAARRLDAAWQRFTRMRDFGYSKSAEETLRIWGHEEALADVVWVIRSFRPDVIIARFGEEPPNHGHHTASAILVREAFAAAADPQRFPEQLGRGVEPWQATRLLRNVSQWREDPPPSDALPIEVGGYDVRLGLGYGELAALSRSQHKSQGFGVAGERGVIVERFVAVAGAAPEGDFLDGIDLGWSRFGAVAAPLSTALGDAVAALDRDHPERAIPALLRARVAFAALPDVPRVRDGRRALDQDIAAAAGLFVRANAARPTAVPGSSVEVVIELVARRLGGMRVRHLTLPGEARRETDTPLPLGEKVEITAEVGIAPDAAISAPYWLAAGAGEGRQTVADARLIGEPTGPPPLTVRIEITAGDGTISLDVPVVHSWTDRVHGERIRLFRIVPPATVTPSRRAVLLVNGESATASLRVRAGRDALRGEVSLPLPPGWRSDPTRVPVDLGRAGEETTVRFAITAPPDAEQVTIRPTVTVGGRDWSYREDVIDYPHIPLQLVLQPATLRLVPLTIARPAGLIGYLPGSGDTVADDLRSVGMTIETIDEEMLRTGDLDRFAAIVVGIRAYNTRPDVRTAHARLMRYAENGGTVVVQYATHSTSSPLEVPIGPYPLQIDRGRVTDETAPMTPVDPEHVVLRVPNRIAASDFEGWVQERGLYFAQTWDDRYQPIFSVADPGERPQLGGLLVAEHGRGRWVYTGLAFFRQLPAGVPGAYRLFANLLAGRP
jgi:LmbE family N-acetylglucosaminyl deacetylase